MNESKTNLEKHIELVNQQGDTQFSRPSAFIPTHYPNAGENDLIAFSMDNNVGAVEFNIMKYILRYKDKNGLEDLLKAKTYLDRLIEKNS